MVKQPADRAGTYDDEVVRVVEQVPPGRALTYGDVAELIGYGSARSVGASMGRCGHEVAWWRVVRHDGTLPGPLTEAALEHWDEEGAALRPGLRALDLARARWDAAPLLDAQDAAGR